MSLLTIETLKTIASQHSISYCVVDGTFFAWEVYSNADLDGWVKIESIKAMKHWLGY